MKTLLFSFIAFLAISQLQAQSYTDKKGNKHLWGNATLDDLKSDEYEKWFTKYSEDYTPELTVDHAENFKDVKVKVFIGTWCGDTKFLLPKFIEEWENMNLDISQLEFIGLHNKGDDYKQGPSQETIGYNIHRVPTFIFYKDETELGRIVERTVFSLPEDMMSIVDESPYEERYQAQFILDEYINAYKGDSLVHNTQINEAYKLIRREVSSSGELNTYGYVLLAQNEIEKAEFVFLLNRYLFPFEPNVRDSYGEFLKDNDRLKEAKVEYEEVLRLKGIDENAVKQLSEIYELLAESAKI